MNRHNLEFRVIFSLPFVFLPISSQFELILLLIAVSPQSSSSSIDFLDLTESRLLSDICRSGFLQDIICSLTFSGVGTAVLHLLLDIFGPIHFPCIFRSHAVGCTFSANVSLMEKRGCRSLHPCDPHARCSMLNKEETNILNWILLLRT
jgi:hypothetical protein